MKARVAAAVLFALAAPASAQRNEVTLEGSVVRGTLGYARATSSRVLVGIEVGFGAPQIDQTITPSTDEDTGYPQFREYLHVGLFVRMKANERLEVDTGLRGSLAELWQCTASDCWPSLFTGAYVQPMFGYDRLKIGTRLTAGWIRDVEEGLGREGIGDEYTFTASLVPILVRVTF